jgi:sec-independent protein translocase protein TatC
MARIRAAQFDERLTLVEHLDELRTRLLISIGVLALAAALCFWQNNLLLDIANDPLPAGFEPLTLSVGEPFMTTLTLSFYAAVVLAMPVVLYQLYAFILPAFSPSELRTVRPLLLMVPFLFVGGVVFGYFVIMPTAVDFLLNFNASQFDIEVRARDYYSFFGISLLAIGVLFQIPVGVLAVTRLGIVTPAQLAQNRRYAILVIAILAMVFTSPDPATMLITMVPLLALYELSVLLARAFGRSRSEEADITDEAARGSSVVGRPPAGSDPLG